MFSIAKTLPQHAALKVIVLMRFATLACLGSMLLLSSSWLRIALPLLPLASLMLALLLFNLWSWGRMQRSQVARDTEVFAQLLVDVVGLSAMLYLSGGATNPFVSFYLPTLAIAAAVLPWRHALALSALAVMAYSMLTAFYLPLQLGDPERAISYHLAGMWANFSVSAALITWYVASLSRTVRQRDAQLAAARMQQVDNERLLALAVQAANVAHALGTPLSTIAIIAEELRHETNHLGATGPMPPFVEEELKIIEDQVRLCKAALESMGQPATQHHAGTRLASWFADFLDQWRLRYPATVITRQIADIQTMPGESEALAQILTTLFDNAAQATSVAGAQIHASLELENGQTVFRVRDSGTGIAPALLLQLGYQQVKSSTGRGIGLLLAFATARQINAEIVLESAPGKGTCATVRLKS